MSNKTNHGALFDLVSKHYGVQVLDVPSSIPTPAPKPDPAPKPTAAAKPIPAPKPTLAAAAGTDDDSLWLAALPGMAGFAGCGALVGGIGWLLYAAFTASPDSPFPWLPFLMIVIGLPLYVCFGGDAF